MSRQNPSNDSSPNESPVAGEPSVLGRGTRRTMLGGAGAALIAGASAVIAACGGSKKTKTKTSAKTTTSSVSSTETSASGATNAPLQRGHTITISVNGKEQAVTAVQGTMLLYVLRDQLGLRGPKFGCGLSECGACAVLANGNQIRSCVTPLSTVGSQKIVTLEGLADSYDGPGKTEDGQLHPLQQAWIDEQVPQCGYCQSGMIIQAADLLSTTKHPTTAEIKQNMNGHLCRCGTYNGIIRAIDRAAGVMSS
jgi:aerobic-type carbon monoxide dehydrogenase small subunit (CoxS/CutS family)